MLHDDALIAYPTDSCYALGFALDSRTGADRIRRIRHLDERHHFTLVCLDFAQLGQFVQLNNAEFRAIKAGHSGAVHIHPRSDTGGAQASAHPRSGRSGCASPIIGSCAPCSAS